MAENMNKTARFSKSVGAGIKSVLNPSGREFYVLEYKNDSKQHKKGDKQKVIVDYIELGRDGKCLVQFDESYSTVSRVHAAIVKDGNNWKLIHLSKTNPTLLNGKPVAKEWYLQDGDEIQLSFEGPKIVFILPINNTTSTLGLGQRMTLFRQQALKPYKTTIAVLSTILVLAVASLVFWNIKSNEIWENKFDQTTHVMDSLRDALINESQRVLTLNEENLIIRESSEKEIKALKQQQEEAAHKAKEQQDRINDLESKLDNNVKNEDSDYKNSETPKTVETQGNIEKAKERLTMCSNSLKYIYMNNIDMIYEESGKEQLIEDISLMTSGLSFYGNDGILYTSRKLIEPWYYFNENDNNMRFLNIFDVNMGSVISSFTIVSSDFTRTTTNSQAFNIGRSNDISGIVNIKNRGDFSWKKADFIGSSGWAYNLMPDENNEGFIINKNYIPKQGDILYYYEYPNDIGANIDGIYPSIKSISVEADNLTNGYIITEPIYSNGNVEGSPVIYIDNDNNVYVVGLLTIYGNGVMCIGMSAVE